MKIITGKTRNQEILLEIISSDNEEEINSKIDEIEHFHPTLIIEVQDPDIFLSK